MALKVSQDWSAEEGRRIKRHRKALGLSQEEMAAKFGFKQTMISRVENGKPPSVVVAVALRMYMQNRNI